MASALTAELLDTWAADRAAWVRYIAITGDGRLQDEDEVPEYSSEKLRVYPGTIVVQRLRQRQRLHEKHRLWQH